MLALLQRVSEARVIVDGETIGEIGPGLLALVCAERGDTPAEADKLLAKMLKLRIFADEAGKWGTGNGGQTTIIRTHRNPGMEPRHCTTDSTGLECNHSHQREALQHAFHHRTKHP